SSSSSNLGVRLSDQSTSKDTSNSALQDSSSGRRFSLFSSRNSARSLFSDSKKGGSLKRSLSSSSRPVTHGSLSANSSPVHPTLSGVNSDTSTSSSASSPAGSFEVRYLMVDGPVVLVLEPLGQSSPNRSNESAKIRMIINLSQLELNTDW